MANLQRTKVLTTIQAKINQIEMLRQRGVDLSNAEVFYSWPGKDGDVKEEVIVVNEDELFPEWVDLIRMKSKEQDAVIKRFNEVYELVTQEGDTILNTRYPSTQYRAIDRRTKMPLDHLFVFYPTPKKDGKFSSSEFDSIIKQFMPDVENNPKTAGGRHGRLDDVIVILLTDIKVTIPGSFKADYDKRIQVMYHDQIYPPNHVMYSVHQKVPEAEAQQMIAELDVKRSQLPRLYENEQICRYFGWYPNDIIRIYRRASGIPSIIRESVVEIVVVPGDPPFPKTLSKIIY